MENTYKTALINRLQDKSAKISVLGLGYVGLPLATVFAEAGFQVIGVDPDPAKITALHNGESYVLDVPDEQEDGERQGVRVDGPLQGGHAAAEFAVDRGQRGDHHEGVQRDHEEGGRGEHQGPLPRRSGPG